LQLLVNFSTSEENHIKTIFHLQQKVETVTTNELAEKLHNKPASVTDMLKKLKAKKIVHYQPYQGFRLTAEGEKQALSIIRRHRLWEFFLAEKLNFKWDEVHDVAEDLEHVSSRQLIERLDEFLGFPKFDPHGDPIPDNQGRVEINNQQMLTEIPVNKPVAVSQIINQSAALLEMLKHQQIQIGTRMEIKKRFEFDNSIEIKIRNKPAFTISEQQAQNIFVKHG
jgi:DtxR family transcriptional regulator, Mn-dependent transcriptional regulator